MRDGESVAGRRKRSPVRYWNNGSGGGEVIRQRRGVTESV